MVSVLLSLGLVEVSLLRNVVSDFVLAASKAKALFVLETTEPEQIYYLNWMMLVMPTSIMEKVSVG